MNLKLFFVLFTAALSAGCGLIHGVTSLSTSVALIPVAIGDGVLGTNMASSARNGVEEAFKEGKLMQSDDIKNEISNSTLHTPSSIIFLDENGTALSEEKKRIVQDKWIVKTGELCIPNKFCYEIRTKNNQLLCPVDISFRKGDGAGLSTRLERQIKDDNQKKLAEAEKAERKRLTDSMYEEAAKLSSNLACEDALNLDRRAQSQDGQEHSENDKSDGYRISFSGCEERIVEAKCMATPKCRAKKEAEERQRQAEAKRQEEYERAHRCDHVYAGKTFKDGWIRCQVIGFSSASGKVTISRNFGNDTWTNEVSCYDIPK